MFYLIKGRLFLLKISLMEVIRLSLPSSRPSLSLKFGKMYWEKIKQKWNCRDLLSQTIQDISDIGWT